MLGTVPTPCGGLGGYPSSADTEVTRVAEMWLSGECEAISAMSAKYWNCLGKRGKWGGSQRGKEEAKIICRLERRRSKGGGAV